MQYFRKKGVMAIVPYDLHLMMEKRFFFVAVALMLCLCPAMAQNSLNNNADNIVGTYSGQQGSDRFRAKIVKLANGTYRGQIIWLENDCDAQGNKLLDANNPDKSKRNTPADRIVLFSGLAYDAEHHRWSGTKIYDPQRGIRANMTAEFTADGQLRIRGTLLGIGETIYWRKR